MNINIDILDGPLPDASAAPVNDGVGAVVRFEGIVRPVEDDQPIRGLNYEAYEPMATNQLHTLAQQVIDRYGVTAVRVEHSRGFVGVGQCSFRLVIMAPHRKEALAAMDRFIDQLKRDVPIWKRPVFGEQLEPTR